MTVAGWVLFGIIVVIAACICIFSIIADINPVWKVLVLMICVICVLGAFAGFKWYFKNTESGKRAVKTQKSNFEGGTRRKVTVYDVNGNAIQEYDGEFDVTYDNDRILFDDEKGLRHIIYYPTGTVIVDEMESK